MDGSSDVQDQEKALIELPPKPDEPLPSDCCGSGCSPCVFDIYERDLKNWKQECKQLQNINTEDQKQNDTKLLPDEDYSSLSPTEFTKFCLEAIFPVNEDTSIYRFNLVFNQSLGLSVGQHLVLRSKKDDGKFISRSYTPISSPDTNGYFEVIIKIYKDGFMSKCVEGWTAGDLIEWRGPFGSYVYKQNQYKHITMLAAGTGIAPMLQIISTVLDNENDNTMLLLIYSCKKTSDILMKDILDEYKLYWNFTVVYCITQMDSADSKHNLKYGDTVQQARISEDFLSEKLPEGSQNSQVLICGTKAFDKDMINYVKKLGYDDGNIFRF